MADIREIKGLPENISAYEREALTRFILDVLSTEVFILGSRFNFERLLEISISFKQQFLLEQGKKRFVPDFIDLTQTALHSIDKAFAQTPPNPYNDHEMLLRSQVTEMLEALKRVRDSIEGEKEKQKQLKKL